MDSKRFAEKYFLTEDEIAVREVAHDFAVREVLPMTSALDQHDQEFPAELMRKAGDAGLLGLLMPEKYGGSNLSTICQMLAVEEISKVSEGFAAVMQSHSGTALGCLLLGGTEKQKETTLAEAIRGERIACFALTEPNAGSDSGALKTNARLEGDTWILNGQKAWITNLTSGGFFVVAARTDPLSKGGHGISVFYVDSNTPGLTIGKPERKLGNRCQISGPMYFDNCRLPYDSLLGKEGEGFSLMMKGLDGGRLGIAALALGIAQDCYDRSVAYSREREQFGKPIAKFQTIAFYLADMASRIDIARTMLYNACRMKDAGLDFSAEAAAVKVFASELAVKAADTAIQIHGGNGYSEEYIVERHWRDSKMLTIGEGTNEINRIVISRKCLAGEY